MSDLVSALFEQELRREVCRSAWMMSPIDNALSTREGSFWCRSTTWRGPTTVTAMSLGSPLSSTSCSAIGSRSRPKAQPSIPFALEPSDHAEPCELRTPLSKQVDRVPVSRMRSRGTITWITQAMRWISAPGCSCVYSWLCLKDRNLRGGWKCTFHGFC